MRPKHVLAAEAKLPAQRKLKKPELAFYLQVCPRQIERMMAVTNELLHWTIELQKRGIKGEDMDFNEKEKQTAAHQTFKGARPNSSVMRQVPGNHYEQHDH